MKVKNLEVFLAEFPLVNPYYSRFYGRETRFNMAYQVIVKITAENGAFGFGATAPVARYHGMTHGMIIEAIKYLREFVIDSDPFQIESIHHLMDWAMRQGGPAKCAIDLALYDLMGKITGQPAYSLIGGKQRDDFTTTATISTGREHLWNPREVADEARRLWDQGYRAYELHVGKGPGRGYEEDLEKLALIRGELGPEAAIDCDAHRNWNIKEAVAAGEDFFPYKVYIEQPCENIADLAEVRRLTRTPIIADENCQHVEDAVEIIRQKAADAICIKPIKAGGLFKAKKMASLAESFGLMTRVDGIPGESRLSNTASAHLVLTLRTPIVCGVMQHTRNEGDIIAEGGLEFKDGKVTVPDLPGLGAVIDESRLRAV